MGDLLERLAEWRDRVPYVLRVVVLWALVPLWAALLVWRYGRW